MKIFLYCTLTLVAFTFCPVLTHAQENIQWQDAVAFEIEGKGWIETAAPYARLPTSAEAKVNELAWRLSKDSAGIAVRFTTDAPSVAVRWSLTSAGLSMPHMPATGCSGLDLYARNDNNEWRFVGNYRPHNQDNEATAEFHDGAKPDRECLLYLPLYNGISALSIGVPDGSRLLKAAPRPDHLRQPIVVYGSSITQGGCASRPGMNWTSILGRLLDRPVINLGTSASGTMAPPIGEVLAELDVAAYIIDASWNMGVEQDVFHERTTHLVESIRKVHPNTPIIFVGQSLIHPDAHPTDLTTRQQRAVERLQAAGANRLTMVPGTDLVGVDGEGTVDGVHYNDIGMQRQAMTLHPIVEAVLAEAAENGAQ